MQLRDLLLLTVVTSSTCLAAVVNINFDELAEGTNVANTYAAQGVTFTNALVQTRNMSLSPIYPPASNPNVAFNDPGAIMEIDFSTPQLYFIANFTYAEDLTVQFVNGNIIFKTIKGSCPFGNTLASSCISGPNDPISFYSPDQPITEVRVYTASIESDTFAIDNISTAPEPVTGMITGSALLAVALRKKSARR